MFWTCWITLVLTLNFVHQAFAQLINELDISIPAWLSFNSKDGVNVVSGDSLPECVAVAESSKKIVAVGINCTPPRFIRDLILSIGKVFITYALSYENEWIFLNQYVVAANIIGVCICIILNTMLVCVILEVRFTMLHKHHCPCVPTSMSSTILMFCFLSWNTVCLVFTLG